MKQKLSPNLLKVSIDLTSLIVGYLMATVQ